MSIQDFIKKLAEKQDISQKQARENYDAIVETVAEILGDSSVEELNLTNFVKFTKSERSARTGRNPATGEPIEIPASVQLRAKPLKNLKDVVKG